MAHGLRIRNPDGTIRLDVSDWLFRVLGYIDVPLIKTATTTSVSTTVTEEILSGTPFWFSMPVTTNCSYGYLPPQVEISGRVITWSFSNSVIVWWGNINGWQHMQDNSPVGGCRIYYGTK
ncbi:MAG: hypothetical protein LBP58_02980 [Azoarcus sp.]|jgi:hypothetical protein|nr:hypothetical protein [Azoarcus sp.]